MNLPCIALAGAKASFNLASVSDEVIKTVVAVLTLVAAAVVLMGLVRAWRARRRPQVVIEDVVAGDGIELSVTGLSAQLRQAVRQALVRVSRDAKFSVLSTLERDIKAGFLRSFGGVQVRTIATGLRSTTEDSLTTLAAGLRAVAAKESEGLLAALSAALPAQRGWIIRVLAVTRGTREKLEVGMVVELAELGHPPDAVTTFWCQAEGRRSRSDPAQQALIRASLYRLLPPAALWIATRLVSRQLARSSVPKRWLVMYRARLSRELAGLQMQLAGQLSLYATRTQKEYDRGFSDQALSDLAEAAERLPDYFRPIATQAAVHERLGWSFKAAQEESAAAEEFRRGVNDYDQALRLLTHATGADAPDRAEAIERLQVRRAKCRLLAGEGGQLLIARRELSQLFDMSGTTSLDLYNAACLFAVAAASPDLPAGEKERYLAQAWYLLGRSLLAGGTAGPWLLQMTDVELETLSDRQRERFSGELRFRNPSGAPINGGGAVSLVEEAMRAIGVKPNGERTTPLDLHT